MHNQVNLVTNKIKSIQWVELIKKGINYSLFLDSNKSNNLSLYSLSFLKPSIDPPHNVTVTQTLH